MTALLKLIGSTVGVVVFLVITLIIEVFAAMTLYMYLALNHVEIFGHLVSLSGDFLTMFSDQLKKMSPELANQAYTTLLGELGPKAMLLLLLGLVVSAVGRLLGWIVRRIYLMATRA